MARIDAVRSRSRSFVAGLCRHWLLSDDRLSQPCTQPASGRSILPDLECAGLVWRAAFSLVSPLRFALHSFQRRRAARYWFSAFAVGLFVATCVAAGLFAFALIEPGHLAQRQALGPAFWALIIISGLMMIEAMDGLALRLAWRAVFVAAMIGLGVALSKSGLFDALSLTREAVSHRTLLVAALARHIELVMASVVLSVIACIPLVWIIRSVTWLRGPLFSSLGLLQTIPSIALFGLLIAPLGFLAARVEGLRALGVSWLGSDTDVDRPRPLFRFSARSYGRCGSVRRASRCHGGGPWSWLRTSPTLHRHRSASCASHPGFGGFASWYCRRLVLRPSRP